MFFIHRLFLLSLCVVALLAFKPAGSVRSKATTMCCLYIICFCFQCVLWYCLVPLFCGICLGVHYSLANILLGKRDLVALRLMCCGCMCSLCYLTVPLISLQSVIVTFYGHTHLLFETSQRTEVGIQCTVLNVLKEPTVLLCCRHARIQKVMSEGANSDNVFFKLMRGERIQIPLNECQRNAI